MHLKMCICSSDIESKSNSDRVPLRGLLYRTSEDADADAEANANADANPNE